MADVDELTLEELMGEDAYESIRVAVPEERVLRVYCRAHLAELRREWEADPWPMSRDVQNEQTTERHVYCCNTDVYREAEQIPERRLVLYAGRALDADGARGRCARLLGDTFDDEMERAASAANYDDYDDPETAVSVARSILVAPQHVYVLCDDTLDVYTLRRGHANTRTIDCAYFEFAVLLSDGYYVRLSRVQLAAIFAPYRAERPRFVAASPYVVRVVCGGSFRLELPLVPQFSVEDDADDERHRRGFDELLDDTDRFRRVIFRSRPRLKMTSVPVLNHRDDDDDVFAEPPPPPAPAAAPKRSAPPLVVPRAAADEEEREEESVAAGDAPKKQKTSAAMKAAKVREAIAALIASFGPDRLKRADANLYTAVVVNVDRSRTALDDAEGVYDRLLSTWRMPQGCAREPNGNIGQSAAAVHGERVATKKKRKAPAAAASTQIDADDDGDAAADAVAAAVAAAADALSMPPPYSASLDDEDAPLVAPPPAPVAKKPRKAPAPAPPPAAADADAVPMEDDGDAAAPSPASPPKKKRAPAKKKPAPAPPSDANGEHEEAAPEPAAANGAHEEAAPAPAAAVVADPSPQPPKKKRAPAKKKPAVAAASPESAVVDGARFLAELATNGYDTLYKACLDARRAGQERIVVTIVRRLVAGTEKEHAVNEQAVRDLLHFAPARAAATALMQLTDEAAAAAAGGADAAPPPTAAQLFERIVANVGGGDLLRAENKDAIKKRYLTCFAVEYEYAAGVKHDSSVVLPPPSAVDVDDFQL
jgi:hypothetical protein